MVNKLDQLHELMASRESVLVSFSGGLDSALVARIAYEELGDKAVAATLDSETLAGAELTDSRKIAAEIGIKHLIVKTSALDNNLFTDNPNDRCYHCKREEVELLKQVADQDNISCIADGLNTSDFVEHRPGIKATNEAGIWHPLVEANLSKDDIREIAKEIGLSVWAKPSSACLSSRIPYGEKITEKKLKRIELGEDFLKSLGIKQVRVRSHGSIARIEVDEDDMKKFMEKKFRERVCDKLVEIGFQYVTLDIRGYRSGSMDEIL